MKHCYWVTQLLLWESIARLHRPFGAQGDNRDDPTWELFLVVTLDLAYLLVD